MTPILPKFGDEKVIINEESIFGCVDWNLCQCKINLTIKNIFLNTFELLDLDLIKNYHINKYEEYELDRIKMNE